MRGWLERSLLHIFLYLTKENQNYEKHLPLKYESHKEAEMKTAALAKKDRPIRLKSANVDVRVEEEKDLSCQFELEFKIYSKLRYFIVIVVTLLLQM